MGGGFVPGWARIREDRPEPGAREADMSPGRNQGGRNQGGRKRGGRKRGGLFRAGPARARLARVLREIAEDRVIEGLLIDAADLAEDAADR